MLEIRELWCGRGTGRFHKDLQPLFERYVTDYEYYQPEKVGSRSFRIYLDRPVISEWHWLDGKVEKCKPDTACSRYVKIYWDEKENNYKFYIPAGYTDLLFSKRKLSDVCDRFVLVMDGTSLTFCPLDSELGDFYIDIISDPHKKVYAMLEKIFNDFPDVEVKKGRTLRTGWKPDAEVRVRGGTNCVVEIHHKGKYRDDLARIREYIREGYGERGLIIDVGPRLTPDKEKKFERMVEALGLVGKVKLYNLKEFMRPEGCAEIIRFVIWGDEGAE